ncbi:hypothetical protein GWI33_002274 [Rhynchophorus ferrugineus]|uniref:Uncharacterized protein n=1 Tax=Rhynchophorus ferrugineus TaxID=354439 RepID=A0A834HJQ2_RHYFE|nr:hypothetical protein GWI33_002274 [Rhynchophorus ferrugineus]
MIAGRNIKYPNISNLRFTLVFLVGMVKLADIIGNCARSARKDIHRRRSQGSAAERPIQNKNFTRPCVHIGFRFSLLVFVEAVGPYATKLHDRVY